MLSHKTTQSETAAHPSAGSPRGGRGLRFLRGLPAQILLWTIVPLILVLVAVSFGSITLHQQSMREMVAESDAQLAALGATRLNEALQQRALALQTLLAYTDEEADREAAVRRAAPLLSTFDLGAAITRHDNTTGDTRLPLDAPAAALTQALAGAAAQPGKPTLVYSAEAGVPLIVVALALDEADDIAVGAVSGQALGLNDLVHGSGHGGHAVAYIVDPSGRVLYHPATAQIGRNLLAHGGIPDAVRGEAGAAFAQLPGEEEHVIGYAPIPITGWALIVEEPWQQVAVPILQYTLLAPLVVLAAAIASLSAIYFGLQRVVRPLQVLGLEATRLAWGDFQAIDRPVKGINEIRDLQRTLQEMARQIRRYQAGMQDYIAALTETQEDERKRLARELHDDTVQSLIALSQRVKMVELDLAQALERPEQADRLPLVQQRVGELSTMLSDALHSVRDVIRDLRPIYLEELGLVAAVEMLAQTTRREGLQTSFEVSGEERRLSPETEMAVYRIAQAGLSNVMRHAGATQVSIDLAYTTDGMTLSIEDNGSGFVPPEMPGDLATQGHFGLVGMYERASRMGGHLSIRSEPGQGTRVVAFLPG